MAATTQVRLLVWTSPIAFAKAPRCVRARCGQHLAEQRRETMLEACWVPNGGCFQDAGANSSDQRPVIRNKLPLLRWHSQLRGYLWHAAALSCSRLPACGRDRKSQVRTSRGRAPWMQEAGVHLVTGQRGENSCYAALSIYFWNIVVTSAIV